MAELGLCEEVVAVAGLAATGPATPLRDAGLRGELGHQAGHLETGGGRGKGGGGRKKGRKEGEKERSKPGKAEIQWDKLSVICST